MFAVYGNIVYNGIINQIEEVIMFIPSNEVSAFISYGEKVRMYTLWVIVDGIFQNGNREWHTQRARYVKNLANDKDRAINKAVKYASEHGIEFVSTENAKKFFE